MCTCRTTRESARRGAALMEVVLSLAIFVSAASILLASMGSSLEAADRLRMQNMAADLAVTKLSEVQLRPELAVSQGPEPFTDDDGEEIPRLEGWQWQTIVASVASDSLEAPSMTQLTVRITHETSRTVVELTELLPDSSTDEEGEE